MNCKDTKENSRLVFIMERDGEQAAEKFAEQTLALYVKDAIDKSVFESSIAELIRFLEEECDKTVQIVCIEERTK